MTLMMLAVQVATEAVKHADPTWPAVGMAAVAAAGSWLSIVFSRRQIRKCAPPAAKPGPKPGESETCRKHGEEIAGLIEFKANAAGALLRIEGKVDQLLMRDGK